jgi:hypothetical protein
LIEVLVALVVSGLVVSLAYAALQGGLEARERLDRHRNGVESLAGMRTVLGNALRHALSGARGGPDVFSLADRSGPGGPADSLVFLTRGIVAPNGTSQAWRAIVTADSDGLRFFASPLDGSGQPVVGVLPGVIALDVQVLARGSSTWTGDWPDRSIAPQAVALSLVQRGGALPLVVRLEQERSP